MKNEPSRSEPLRGVPTKMVLTKLPAPLLQEMDALCDFNDMDRSEFIILAASQLLDYLDRKVGVRVPRQVPDNYADFDEDLLEAADGDKNETP